MDVLDSLCRVNLLARSAVHACGNTNAYEAGKSTGCRAK